MGYYEFNNYEYYALIGANDEMKAIDFYEKTVADLEEEEKLMNPDLISKEDVKKRIGKYLKPREQLDSLMLLNSEKDEDEPILLLISGDLV